MKSYTEADETARWNSYASANSAFPHARNAEITMQMKLLALRKGETIVEVGTGNGVLTYPMANVVGRTGKIFSFDYRKENLESAMRRNTDALPIVFVPQQNNPQTGQYVFPLNSESVDKVSTIASFHHYDDRSLGTGLTGRMAALKEFYRILKKGGKLVIGDIAVGTATQRYFDGEMDRLDSPSYCHPRGHPHDFLDERTAIELCVQIGFKNIEFKVIDVPLDFNNEEECGTFFKALHNAKCSASESLESVKRHLRAWHSGSKFHVGWNLFYLTADK